MFIGGTGASNCLAQRSRRAGQPNRAFRITIRGQYLRQVVKCGGHRKLMAKLLANGQALDQIASSGAEITMRLRDASQRDERVRHTGAIAELANDAQSSRSDLSARSVKAIPGPAVRVRGNRGRTRAGGTIAAMALPVTSVARI